MLYQLQQLSTCAGVRCYMRGWQVTPDLKLPGSGRLLHVDLGAGARRSGGSSLAQAFGQVSQAFTNIHRCVVADVLASAGLS